MREINLLPWRAQQREDQKQLFIRLNVLCFIAALIVVLIFHAMVASDASTQQYRDGILQQEVDLLAIKTQEVAGLQKQKKQLITRMTIVRDLQAERPLVVRLTDELVKIIPDGIFVTSVKRSGDKFTLTGKAESNTRVSMLMRNIEASQWVTQPVLSEIKTNPNQKPYTNNFTLVMKQSLPLLDIRSSEEKDKDKDKKVK